MKDLVVRRIQEGSTIPFPTQRMQPGETNKAHATYCAHPKTLTEDCPRCLRRKGTLPNVSPNYEGEHSA